MSHPSPVRRFFAAIWNAITWLRIASANLLFLALLAILYFALADRAPEPLPAKAALLLDLSGFVVDQKTPVDPLQMLGAASSVPHEVLVRDVTEAIEKAAEDPAVPALVMELDYLVHVSISHVLEIADALEAFRASGKPIIAVGDYFTQPQYLLASYADEVILHPLGTVGIEGYAVYQNYYAELLEKVSVNVHVFRGGKYKSLAEPWLRNDMSPVEKDLTRAWLDDLWREYTGVVEGNRKLAGGTLNNYVEGMAQRLSAGDGDQAKDAQAMGLADRLMSRTEANDYLADLVGARNDDGLYEAVPFEEYLWHRKITGLPHTAPDHIAVITAQGNMLPGEQPPGTVGGDSLAWLINDAMNDDKVRAIVLRVNSPGGSLFAAEVIREQVEAAQEAGLPVVVSMGPMAASGGYYIAAGADQIWALPTTITGSIGVIAAFPTVEELLQRGGIHTDGVGTTSLAGSLRLDRPLNPQLAQSLQSGIDHAYAVFRGIVAEGRGMTLEQVDAVAEGRVWSGADAKEVGLVDALGGLDDAIAAAAELAGIDDYQVDYLDESLTPSQQFLQQMAERLSVESLGLSTTGRSDSVAALVRLAQPLLNIAREIEALQDPRHLYVRCLPCAAYQ
ncbi:signal peptide peptidase SppA [Haliea sp. E17]|uniref:signal peptide peptidase SppA n=1 Tax=Haliea sp. E17 TaxID=3401576 RepID=UPI003AAE3DD2